MKQYRNKLHGRWWVLVFVCLILTCTAGAREPDTGLSEDRPLKIGVLAVRGAQQCLASWSPTADYLTRQVGRPFIIVPLAHEQIYPVVKNGEVDFILANSAFYVGLEHWYRASRIVTLKEKRGNGIYTKYGGVIFCRKDRTDIRTLDDLKGKSFMAVSESSLGGWLMAWRELQESGLDPYRDFRELKFNETHDRVVYAVRDRLTDAGTVRTNTLEALSAEGKIDLGDYYVFPRLHDREIETPYLLTTREYPDWPMARVLHTPDALAETVAVALLQMPQDSPAARAAGCAGWTIPLNYQPVHDCLRALKVAPYENLGKITVKDALRNYGHWIFFVCAAFCFLVVFTGVVLKLNRRIHTSNVRLSREINLRKQQDQELKQAKEEAETATRAKSEFLANMSHEIRTPMNGVIAATDLALGEDVPPRIEKYLKIIQSSAYSLLGIINDILDFSKIEAGKFDLKERTFRLNEIFDRVMELFVNKALEKGIELLVDMDTAVPRVINGDPLRLQQILTNLISNAVKFTETGGVILVRVREQKASVPDPASRDLVLAFSVKDTGCGIPPEYMGLLFQPFSQADTSSTRKYEGTGLGLSICKQLVTMMGGDIRAESEPGRGSTFFFTVRLRRPPAEPVAKLTVPPDIQGLNVLVVDDLEDSRTIMRAMLESLGLRVETFSSGQDVLGRLKHGLMRSNPVELIMMDWRMPTMDGLQVARRIRQELNLSMPIIMMTAFGRDKERMEAEKAGINGFLTKPIYPSTLLDAIMDGFGRQRTRQGAHRNHFTTKASIYRKPLKGIRILVAEDNPTNQFVAQAILEGAGIEVFIVGNGEAAVEAVKNRPFDAVLMDIQMPRMNGFDATRLIRELPGGKLPIVAMTAHAMKGDEEKCLEAGMDGYISKPVEQDRLFQTLWRLLRPQGDDRPGQEEDDLPAGPLSGSGESGAVEGARDMPFPDSLPGINIQKTLETLAIDFQTLERILAGFGTHNRSTAKALRQAWVSRDAQTLGQLAHSLKGSAANIGARDLSLAAGALESACSGELVRNGEPSGVEDLVARVEARLEQVLSSIGSLSAALPHDASSPASPGPDISLKSLLADLAEAVERADPKQIMKIMSALRRQAGRLGTIDPARINTLEGQISSYDYDQALETIRELDKP